MPEGGKDTWGVKGKSEFFPYAPSFGHILLPVRRLAVLTMFVFVAVKEAPMYFATL